MRKRVKNKLGQEEMVGFVLIIIIVAVILLVLLGISLRKPQKEFVESYEANSFIQAFLQHTTNCTQTYEPNYIPIQKLIFECGNRGTCLDGRKTCDVLESTLKEILKRSWKAGEENPVKGYELKIVSDNTEMLLIKEGNPTKNYKGAVQDFSKSGSQIEIFFTAYY